MADDSIFMASDIKEELRFLVEASLPNGSIQITWIPISLNMFAEYGTAPHISLATYARLLMPSLIPQKIRRVLYIDTDTLILGTVADLWTTRLDGMVLAAVLDGLNAHGTVGVSAATLGMPAVTAYFNAGVLLVDLDQWRADGVTEKALRYLECNPASKFADQDALNVACDGRWKALAHRWNFQNHYSVNIGGLPQAHQPAIAHFVTAAKPSISSYRSPNAALYDTFRARTRFAKTKSEHFSWWVRWWAAGVVNVGRRWLGKDGLERE